MLRKIRAAVAFVLILVTLAAIPAMAAQHGAKGYAGRWKSVDTDPAVEMEIFDDGTMYYVIGDEENVGYYCSYFIAGDGTLCVYEEDSITDAYALLTKDHLLDYAGLEWVRVY